MTFTEKLKTAVTSAHSCLCVGLDPDLRRLPPTITEQYRTPGEQVFHFLKHVIDVTAPHCAAFKPNLGFFEALGDQGLAVFQKVLDSIPDDKIVIADAKRGDISTTAAHYSKAYFQQFDVDSITINPLMGFETLDPFADDTSKGVYVLTLTSNPGADDFLKQPFRNHDSMAAYIARTLAAYDATHATHIGMVIGATQPDEMDAVLHHHSKGALLIPGIGAQGGSVKELAVALQNHTGIPLVNSSRSILYAGEGTADWRQAVEEAALHFKQKLQPITNRYV